MKKQFKILAAVALCAAMCLALAACGSKDKGPTLQSYLDSIQSEIDAQIQQASSSGMTMSVKADGNKLVYRYQYTIDIGISNADAKTLLDDALDGVDSTFQGVLSSLRTAVPSAEAVVVEYVDMNGTTITSRSWK